MICNYDKLSFCSMSIARYSHADGEFHVKPRPHAALCFRLCGTADFEVNGTCFTAKYGDMSFIPADTTYTVRYQKSDSLVIHLLGCNYHTAENMTTERPNVICSAMAEMLHTAGAPENVNRDKAHFFELLQLLSDERLHVSDKAFQEAVSYIKIHFQDSSLKLTDVCRSCFISESTLYRSFIRFYGVSPKQFLLDLRMEYAIRLLHEGEKSIKEIALLSGFSDSKYFSRVVKEAFGFSPSALR